MNLLTHKDILEIPDWLLPMPVLSDNLRSVIGAGIKIHTKSGYNHFMWYLRTGVFASQDPGGFREIPISEYVNGCHRLKFWTCNAWTPADRATIKVAIEKELKQPWWRNRYDFLAYIGHLTGWRWIQSPWADICSDKAKFVQLGSKEYALKHPTPENVDRWFENNETYQVFGRHIPMD